MEMIKLTGFAIIAVVLVSVLRQYVPTFAILAATACSLLLLGLFAEYLQPVLQWAERLSAYVNHEEFRSLLKAAGIALLAQMAQELCKDAGMNALGTAVELGGRCMILACGLPMLEQIMERLVVMLQ